MKTIYKLLVLAIAAVGICSCSDEYQSTPSLYVGADAYLTHSDGSRDTTYFGDTLQIGDTARVLMGFYGISHPLKFAQATTDTAAVACAFECDPLIIKEYLEKDSKPEEGYLHFQPYTAYVWVMYRYVAKKSGTYPMKIEVESFAKEGYSHIEPTFQQVIR